MRPPTNRTARALTKGVDKRTGAAKSVGTRGKSTGLRTGPTPGRASAATGQVRVGWSGITRNGKPVPIAKGNPNNIGKPFKTTETVRQMAAKVHAKLSKPGQPGTAGAQHPKGAGTTGGTRTTTKTTPAAPVVPFLTPAQQLALNNWNTRYGDSLAKLNASDQNALATFNLSNSANQLKAATSSNTTNQNMAARGMFQSSIRDTALNDIATTLANQYNVLHTRYQATLLNDATSRGELQGQNAGQQLYYNDLAVQNAQSVPPNTTPTTTTTTTPAPTATTPTKPPAQPKPAKPRATAAGSTVAAARVRAGMGFPKGNTGYGVHVPTGVGGGAGGVH